MSMRLWIFDIWQYDKCVSYEYVTLNEYLMCYQMVICLIWKCDYKWVLLKHEYDMSYMKYEMMVWEKNVYDNDACETFCYGKWYEMIWYWNKRYIIICMSHMA